MFNRHPSTLIYGNFAPPTFEYCWLEWLQEQQYPVRAFDESGILKVYFPSDVLRRIMYRFFQPILASIVSQHLLKAVCFFKPQLVIVVSGRLVSSSVLQTIHQKIGATLFHFYGEDFFNPLNTTSTLRDSVTFYDHLFTTKSFNVPEMAAIGLDQVSFVPHGYRPNCHFPVVIGPSDREEFGSDLSFVGTWEEERASTLAQLKGFNLRIWGNQWNKAGRELGLQKAIQKRTVYCGEMSKVFNASKINLAFLRKANRDRHTSRTFEIPACGGFQLSERTDEVLGFFEEGREIECFASVDELKDKADYYLKHETQRQRIATAGLARVRNCSYSYTDRLKTILEHYSNQNP